MKHLLTYLALFVVTLAPLRGIAAEPLRDRVLSTGVVRIGYAMNPPILMKDPNTGALSGIFYDVTNALFERLHIKAEWTEEIGWGDFPAALAAGRCDLVACGVWRSPGRIRVADFSDPICYSPMGIWVRADDHRFDKSFTLINDPKVILAVLDGEMSSILAQSVFPQAKTLTLPQLSDIAQNLLNVEAKKADVAFVEPALAAGYLKNHPGKLRNIADQKPFRVFGDGYMLRQGEPELKSMINLMIDQMLSDGTVEGLIKKYEPFPGAYYRVAPPWIKAS